MAAVGSPQDPLSHLTSEERELVLRFLVLIRDNYKKADKAAYFLERRAGVVNNCAMTNLRDVLSHLSTLLDPATPARKRRDQLASAEEHLRRAIIEPYEIGLGTLTEKFTQDYEAYRRDVLPVKDTLDGFGTAPNRTQVESRLQEVNGLALRGKQAKGRNMWDDDWEDGVAAFADAYDKLLALHSEVEEWVFKHNQRQTVQSVAQVSTSLTNTSQHHTRLHRLGIAWTIVGLIIGSLITYAVTKYVAGPDRAPLKIDSPTVPGK